MPLRRKKWTEEEEETLISKYGELLQSGSLSKLKSRERKFQPIAAHVNSLYHNHNSVAYPWLWTWKDASTKVQNMRHQYLGVKQKIRKLVVSSHDPSGHEEAFDWEDGLSHWANFLKYKEVFGDQELDMNDFFASPNPNANQNLALKGTPRHHHHHHPKHHQQFVHHRSQSVSQYIAGGNRNNSGLLLLPVAKETRVVDQTHLNGTKADLTSGLMFAYDDDDGDDGVNEEEEDDDDVESEHDLNDRDKNFEEENDGDGGGGGGGGSSHGGGNGDGDDDSHYNGKKRKRRCGKLQIGNMKMSEARILSGKGAHFAMLLEREERMLERDKEREKRVLLIELEIAKQKKEWERERREMEQVRQQEAERREAEKRERDLVDQQRREMERAREEKMERERREWRDKIENQAMQHQAAMMQLQLQIAQNQQHMIAMLSSGLLQLMGQGSEFPGSGNSVSPFISQLIQNLQAHGPGMVQCGIRRGAGESSDSQFDVDG